MARRSRPAPSASSSSRLSRIDSAFNAAVGYSDPSTSHGSNGSRLSAKQKGKRRAVVPDDEEDDEGDEEMELVAGGEPGGFMPPDGMELDRHAGGFLPDQEQGGGGFLLDGASEGGGGFLPEPPVDGGIGGGFLPEDGSSGGGFLPDPPAFDGGGGFLPEDSTMHDLPPPPSAFASALPGDAFSTAGGFLPASDDDLSTLALPTPARLTHAASLPSPPSIPPPERIPLDKIPAALKRLGLTRAGLPANELLELFEDVASDDEEDAGGGKSVRRERFREACEVLLAGMDSGEESGGEEDGEGEYHASASDGEEVEREEPARRRRSTRTTRASTRAARAEAGDVEAEGDEGGGGGFVKEQDFGAQLDALPDESSSSYGGTSASDGEGSRLKTSAASASKAKAKKGKGKRRPPRGDEVTLTPRDLADAADSFDLFFVDGPQATMAREARSIGLMELQRAARVLGEKMGEGDLNEMLEYAGRSKGKVDLENFARILVETGL
ncbi:hypothetical protein JCM10213_006278 [Rhodosporidiobolus nylandii]